MEQIPIQKKPVGQPISGIPADVVLALLAETGLRQKKSRRRTLRRCSKKSKDSAPLIKKPKPEPLSQQELRQKVESQFDGEATNADVRLREFLRRERCLIEKDGTEHIYDPDEGRVYTLEEVGSVMGVTRERVRQIEETALRKMWRLIRSINMREDLDENDWIEGVSHGGDDTVYLPETL